MDGKKEPSCFSSKTDFILILVCISSLSEIVDEETPAEVTPVEETPVVVTAVEGRPVE